MPVRAVLVMMAMVACTPDPGPGSAGPAGSGTFRSLTAEVDETYPTVLHVGWEQAADMQAVRVRFSADGGDTWQTTPARELEAGPQSDVIVGVPYDTEVAWLVEDVSWIGPRPDPDATETGEETGEETSVGRSPTEGPTTRTGRASLDMPEAEVVLAATERADPDVRWFVGVVTQGPDHFDPGWTLVFDREGTVVWAHQSPRRTNTMQSQPSAAGNTLLIDHSTYFSNSTDRGRSSEIVELTLDGTRVRTIPAPGQHHAYTSAPDGTVYFASYRIEGAGPPADDVIVRVDPDGTQTDVFSCWAWGEPQDRSGHQYPWCGSNTIRLEPAHGLVLYSLFTWDTVLEISMDTWEVERHYGQLPGSLAFDPEEARIDYQHGPRLVPYDDERDALLVSTHSSLDDREYEIAVREFLVDRENGVLEQVWSWGEGLGVTGRGMGEVHRLPSGNTLQNYGTNAVMREVTRDGELVWDLRFEATERGPTSEPHHKMGRTTPLYGEHALYDFVRR